MERPARTLPRPVSPKTLATPARPRRLAIGAAAIALLYALGIDPLVRRSMERLAQDALQVPVRVDRARVRLRGTAALYGFSIANPPVYEEPEACHFDSFDGYVDVHSLFGNEIDIHDLVLTHPVFTVEYAHGKSNWATLIDTLSGTPGKRDPPPETHDATTFRITRLRIIDGIVRFKSSLAGGEVTTARLPDLELENFWTAPGTASTLKIIFALLFQVLGGGAMAQEDVPLPSEVRTSFTEEMKGAAKVIKGLSGSRK